MAVRIFSNTIPGIDYRANVQQALVDGIGDRPGDFMAHILAPADSASWFITIEGPHGRWHQEFFGPIEQEPSGRFIRETIAGELPR